MYENRENGMINKEMLFVFDRDKAGERMYFSTRKLLQEAKISRETLYGMLRRGEIAAPPKRNGRFLWEEKHIKDISAQLKKAKTDEGNTFSLNDKKYYAGKAKMAQFIRDAAEEHFGDFESFADLFAGVGNVSQAFADKTLVLNDSLYAAYVYLEAWFSPEAFEEEKIRALLDAYNNIEETEENYVSRNFGGTYFSMETARNIGAIRAKIEAARVAGEINKREQAILLASLLQGMDEAANIYAHYDTAKKAPKAWKPFFLKFPAVKEKAYLAADNKITAMDANLLASWISADIIYLDPPMDSRQYGAMYHLPENIVRWEQEEVTGVSGKPKVPYAVSEYCKKDALQTFENLVLQLRAPYLMATYVEKPQTRTARSESKMHGLDMLDVLRHRGRVQVVFPPLKPMPYQPKQLLLTETFAKEKKKRKEANENGLILTWTGEKTPAYTPAPMYEAQGKFTALPYLLPFFPKGIDTFYDVFAGYGTVGLNASANHVVYVDQDPYTLGLAEAIATYGKEQFLAEVFRIIEENNLSLTSRYGYHHYGVDSEAGLAEVNKIPYIRLRTKFNQMQRRDISYWATLYVLSIYAYNGILRFNQAGEFNQPVGKRDFNGTIAARLQAYAGQLAAESNTFLIQDFQKLDVSRMTKYDFVYLDPPKRNKAGWGNEEQKGLYDFLERLLFYEIPFALTTVTAYADGKNEMLEEWLREKEGRYRLIHNSKQEKTAALILNR